MVTERGGTGESRNTDVPQTPKIAEQQSVEQSGTVLRLHPVFERLSQALKEQQDEQQAAEQSDNLPPLHPIWERVYQVLSKPKEVRHIRQPGGGITADARKRHK